MLRTLPIMAAYWAVFGHGSAMLQRRDYNPDEYLVLGDCGVTPGDPNSAASSWLASYFSSKPLVLGGDASTSMFMYHSWDGSYPWRPDGVSLHAENGDTFQVYIDPSVSDWDAKNNPKLAGSARHTFDGHDFKCWADHGKQWATYQGEKCYTAYICAHGDNMLHQKKLTFNPHVDVVHWEKAYVYSTDIFGDIPKGGDDDLYCASGKKVSIPGTQCTISFECGPEYAHEMSEAVLLMAHEVTSSLQHGSETISVCDELCPAPAYPVPGCPTTPHCCDGKTHDVEQPWTKVPRKGTLDLFVDGHASDARQFSYEISCPAEPGSLACEMCSGIKYGLSVGALFNPIFGAGYIGATVACDTC